MDRKGLKWNNQAGMTLIELLAAITILAIIIGPIFQLTLHAYTSYVDDQRKVKALAIAQQKLEEAKVNNNWLKHYSDDSSYLVSSLKSTGELTYLGTDYDDFYLVNPQNLTDPLALIDNKYRYIVLMKSNGSDMITIRVNVYWEEITDGNILTYLITEVREPS